MLTLDDMLYLGKLNVSISICHTTTPVSKRLQRFVQAPRKKKDLCRRLGITTRLSFSVVILCSVLQEHLVILILALCESLEVFVLAPLNNYRVVVLSTFLMAMTTSEGIANIDLWDRM